MIKHHLKRLREAAGLTQSELGRRLGFRHQTAISNIECGRTAVSSHDLARWLDETSASVEDRLEALRLLGGAESDATSLAS